MLDRDRPVSTRRRVALVALVLVLALVALGALVACSSDEDAEATPPVTVIGVPDGPTPSPTPTATPTAEPASPVPPQPTEEAGEGYPGPVVVPVNTAMPGPYPTPSE